MCPLVFEEEAFQGGVLEEVVGAGLAFAGEAVYPYFAVADAAIPADDVVTGCTVGDAVADCHCVYRLAFAAVIVN